MKLMKHLLFSVLALLTWTQICYADVPGQLTPGVTTTLDAGSPDSIYSINPGDTIEVPIASTTVFAVGNDSDTKTLSGTFALSATISIINLSTGGTAVSAPYNSSWSVTVGPDSQVQRTVNLSTGKKLPVGEYKAQSKASIIRSGATTGPTATDTRYVSVRPYA